MEATSEEQTAAVIDELAEASRLAVMYELPRLPPVPNSEGLLRGLVFLQVLAGPGQPAVDSVLRAITTRDTDAHEEIADQIKDIVKAHWTAKAQMHWRRARG
jgi:hypothetical protein